MALVAGRSAAWATIHAVKEAITIVLEAKLADIEHLQGLFAGVDPYPPPQSNIRYRVALKEEPTTPLAVNAQGFGRGKADLSLQGWPLEAPPPLISRLKHRKSDEISSADTSRNPNPVAFFTRMSFYTVHAAAVKHTLPNCLREAPPSPLSVTARGVGRSRRRAYLFA